MTSGPSFQSLIPDNFCFGCGPENPDGLQIQSFWSGPDESICVYQPLPHQAAGPRIYLNGGIIGTLIDCHAICTAVADAYRAEGRDIGSEPHIWCATASLKVNYLRPTPIDSPVDIRATLREAGEKKTVLECSLSSGGERCAEGEVLAVRVPPEWRHGR